MTDVAKLPLGFYAEAPIEKGALKIWKRANAKDWHLF